RAVRVERLRQLLRDGHRVATLDVAALHHVDELAVAQQRNRRRRGRVASEVLARTIGGLEVEAGEDRRHRVRPREVAQRQRETGPGLAGGAAADRVDDDHQRPRRVADRRIDVGGGPQLTDTEVAQLFAHRRDEKFRIGHREIVLPYNPQPGCWGQPSGATGSSRAWAAAGWASSIAPKMYSSAARWR